MDRVLFPADELLFGRQRRWNCHITGTATGNILSDFLIGQPHIYQGTLFGFYDRQWYVDLYAQDSWKMTPRLTINDGVRWEPYTSIYNAYGQIVNFIPRCFMPASRAACTQMRLPG